MDQIPAGSVTLSGLGEVLGELVDRRIFDQLLDRDFATHAVLRRMESAYVEGRIEASQRRVIETCMSAVGEVLVEQKAKLIAEYEARLEREIAKIRTEFLQDRLDAERGKKLRVVPPRKRVRPLT